MKIIKILQENTVKPYHRNIIKHMLKIGLDDDDLVGVWNFLTKDLSISDIQTKSEILHLFKKYYNTPELVGSISDSDLDDLEDYSELDNEQIALSLFLDIPYLLIEEQDWKHYGLKVYNDLVEDKQYAVGDDWDASQAMSYSFDGYVDQVGGVQNLDRSLVEDFIEPERYSVSELAREEAEDIISNMDDEEIIEKAGYDISDYSEEEIGDLLDTAKEELLDTIAENVEEEIKSEGVDWFTDRGWSYEDAIRGYFDFDESGLETYLAENEDRGNTLAGYDGYENEQFYNNDWYYIYRIN